MIDRIMTDWLTDWLIDWFIDWLIEHFDLAKWSIPYVIAVFKVDDDPNLDDEDVVIPTANTSGSGGHRTPHTAEDDADEFDDFWRRFDDAQLSFNISIHYSIQYSLLKTNKL